MAIARVVWLCATLMLAWSAPALAEPLGGGQAGSVSWIRVAGALTTCLALAVAGGLLLKAKAEAPLLGAWPALLRDISRRSLRWPPASLAARPMRQMRLVETLRLTPQVQMHLIECDGRRMMVATTATRVELLTELKSHAQEQG